MEIISKILAIILFLAISCNNKNSVENYSFKYDKRIIDLGLETKFDSAAWLIYEFNALEDTLFTCNNETEVNILKYEPKLVWSEQIQDTIIFTIDFEFNTTKYCVPKAYHSYHSIIYINGKIKKIGIGDGVVAEYTTLANKQNYQEKNFISILNRNKRILNKWLISEAKKRHLLE